VEAGYASVHFTAEKTNYFRALKIAEDNVKARRENVSAIGLKFNVWVEEWDLIIFF